MEAGTTDVGRSRTTAQTNTTGGGEQIDRTKITVRRVILRDSVGFCVRFSILVCIEVNVD